MTQYQGSTLNQYMYNGGNNKESELIGGFPIQNLIGLYKGGLSGGGYEIHNKFMNLIVPDGLIIEDLKSLNGDKNTVYKTHDANQEIDNELFNKLFGDVATTMKSKKQTKKIGSREPRFTRKPPPLHN